MDYLELLEKELGKDMLEKEIKSKIKSFHGLLTREAAIRLLAKEKNLIKKDEEKEYKISEIPKGKGTKKITIRASVKKVWQIAQYSSGKRSRVVEIKDETGSALLILWNEDVKLANGLRSGDKIQVKGVYEKNNELHLGYSGKLDIVERAGFLNLSAIPDQNGDHIHARGFVISKVQKKEIEKNGRKSSLTSFVLGSGEDNVESSIECIIYSAEERSKNLQIGDELIIEDAELTDRLIWIGSGTKILSRRPKEMLIGKIEKIECVGSDSHAMLNVVVSGKEVSFERERALSFLGVKVAEDIALETIVTLKKESLLSKEIALRI